MGIYHPLDNSLGLHPRPIISRAVYAHNLPPDREISITNTPRVIPICIHCIAIVFVTVCFIMTCTLYTSQCRSRSNETNTCKYTAKTDQQNRSALKLL